MASRKPRPRKRDLWSTYKRRLERRRKSRRWEEFEEVLFSGQVSHSIHDLQEQLLEVAECTFELWWRLEAIRTAAQQLLPPLDHDVDLFPTPQRRKEENQSEENAQEEG